MNFRNEDGSIAYDGSYDEWTQEFLTTVFRQGQAAGEFRAFDVTVMANTLRAAVDSVPLQLQFQPDVDLDGYGAELATIFDRATRAE
jgi:hypothetical protein